MTRVEIKIVIADGINKSEVSFESNHDDMTFEEVSERFEKDFLSPEKFMSINTGSSEHQNGHKMIIRKSLVSVFSIKEIKHPVWRSFGDE